MAITIDEIEVADPADACSGAEITTLRHHALGMSVRSAMISAPILGG